MNFKKIVSKSHLPKKFFLVSDFLAIKILKYYYEVMKIEFLVLRNQEELINSSRNSPHREWVVDWFVLLIPLQKCQCFVMLKSLLSQLLPRNCFTVSKKALCGRK